ncbi:TPA: hypothetical protein ACJGWF_004694, partial [Salmonella enterica subsp. enterica serovar Mississippi]
TSLLLNLTKLLPGILRALQSGEHYESLCIILCMYIFNISTSCHGGIRSFTTVITRASVITV